MIAHRNLLVDEVLRNILIKTPRMKTWLTGEEVFKAMQIDTDALVLGQSSHASVWMTLALSAGKQIIPCCIIEDHGAARHVFHKDGSIQALPEDKWQTIEVTCLPQPAHPAKTY